MRLIRESEEFSDAFNAEVFEVLADCLSLERRKIQPGSRLVEDLSADSITVVEMVMALNDRFGIELPAAGVESFRTVADVCRLVMMSRQEAHGPL
ncbi:phosphopantetheine-binding protein [Pseudomonas sp. 14P_8.1_Bac3]|uniref:phosphopantetheine-binding protein n=1 Tax=Pseudomonas sp. 14P_8.1_Bac3 TaxID=2971621 RepID=UPI0021C8FA7A|nr:phosphopantetheine-binding protein [Pseudomonas sp. 14P_8.1_Bac3]MCU1761467.1 phosphopantetheine-binding protein [Pseudomonas sp. 14P_8.1_Bac3]